MPAYLSGTLRDIDIFAHNELSTELRIGALVIPASKRVSIQVKTWSDQPRSDAVDYLIGLNAISEERSFNAEWVLTQVKQCPPGSEVGTTLAQLASYRLSEAVRDLTGVLWSSVPHPQRQNREFLHIRHAASADPVQIHVC